MKEFIEKLIGRLEEQKTRYREIRKNTYCRRTEMDDCDSCRADHYLDARIEGINKAKEIANQLAEEYADCYKDCGQCEAYDKEKHYCPKFCKVITEAVAEIEENHKNDFCEWQEISAGGITAVKEPHRMKLFNCDEEQKYCPYCGKKIKIAPYQPKGE